MEKDRLETIPDPFVENCLRALFEKDRLDYAGRFVQGFVHNANGPLQNLSMLTEMILAGVDQQERILGGEAVEKDRMTEILDKQRKRLVQIREQIYNLAGALREFMQLHELERSGAEIDLNALLTRMLSVYRSDLFFKHRVQAELRLEKNLPPIPVPGRDLVPAFFHIFQNAMTAMRDSPTRQFTIETGIRDGEVLVKFRDSGCGVAEGKDPESFFEPFESDWPQQQGSAYPERPHLGFGLYAVRKLLSPHGVSATLESDSEGALAIVRIPLPPKRA